jgi:tripartite-type tricarboxylate transporter receptor subunit TctC
LNDKTPYDPLTDLKPIALVGGIPLILVANPSLQVKTFKEFIAAAKAKPGSINYASSGIGASHHMSMENLQRVAGIKLNHVSYKGGAPALTDVLGGHVPVMWVAMSTALPHIQAGKLVPLAYGGLERSELLPNIPTVAELGFPGFEAGNWVGVMGPAKMPAALVQKIQNDLRKVTQTPGYREHLIAGGNEVRTSTSEEFSKRVHAEYSRNKVLLSKSAIAHN